MYSMYDICNIYMYHMCVCVCACVRACVRACVYICHVYIYIYIYVCMHVWAPRFPHGRGRLRGGRAGALLAARRTSM
jgi:hypothetical protein